MHDPNTVAFEIRRPWPQVGRPGFKRGIYWPPLITIWHVDPERGGSDDSCGWSHPILTKGQRAQIDFLAGCEARSPWFNKEAEKEPYSASEAETLLRGAFLAVARSLRMKLTVEHATELAIDLVNNPVDNLRSRLAFLPGYHSNTEEDRQEDRKRAAFELLWCISRVLLREARPWWRHPRWHFWHWKVQIHPLQDFKRWAWSRCCKCGGRFRWGECPTSDSWHARGPAWFRGETDVYHSRCGGSAEAAAAVDGGGAG